jgi:hypothetical protein
VATLVDHQLLEHQPVFLLITPTQEKGKHNMSWSQSHFASLAISNKWHLIFVLSSRKCLRACRKFSSAYQSFCQLWEYAISGKGAWWTHRPALHNETNLTCVSDSGFFISLVRDHNCNILHFAWRNMRLSLTLLDLSHFKCYDKRQSARLIFFSYLVE